MAPLVNPDSKEHFLLPIGPNKEFAAQIFATSNGVVPNEYSLIIGYKKPPLSPALSSTLTDGPEMKLRNFPKDTYDLFVARANLDQANEALLANLIREIFAQGLKGEELHPPSLAAPFFGDKTDLGTVPSPSALPDSTVQMENATASEAEEGNVSSNFVASSTPSESSELKSDVASPSVEEDQEPVSTPEKLSWWDKAFVPVFFEYLENLR